MGEKKWRALDHCDFGNNGAVIDQDPNAVSNIDQESFEWIVVKDSEGVTVNTVDTQIAAQLQTAVQTAIGIITATLVGNVQGQVIAQELNAVLKTNQRNTQKTVIEGSKNITVSTTDTDVAANVQVAAQTLTAVVTAILVGNVSGG
ncbi:spore coat protein [Priestia megaterium]|jgi:spore coat protein X|uniref:spore coat protein n=1 Tax=Priestia megaterium TaxID=1404 RepID=UPI0012D9F4D8|nr:spore coat protein [Priestia megaterium]MUL34254.1 Spore coat protein X [Priestia megaterium]QSX24024.1 spore coat protein [Priestia megaterium]